MAQVEFRIETDQDNSPIVSISNQVEYPRHLILGVAPAGLNVFQVSLTRREALSLADALRATATMLD